MKYLLLTLTCLISFSSYSQKVKYKKGKVFVDKEHKFNFIKIDNPDTLSNLNNYALSDLDGTEIMTLKDTVFYYEKLSNEIEMRRAYEAYICSVKGNGLSAVMPYNPVMGYPKQRIKDLKKVGFFKDNTLDKDKFDKFIEKQYPKAIADKIEEVATTNNLRKKVYELTLKEFGAIKTRKPGKVSITIDVKNVSDFVIRDRGVVIGRFVSESKGSHNHSYSVVNPENNILGMANIFQKPEVKTGISFDKYNLRMEVNQKDSSLEEFQWFNERVPKTGAPKSLQFKLEKMANYLVNHGYL